MVIIYGVGSNMYNKIGDLVNSYRKSGNSKKTRKKGYIEMSSPGFKQLTFNMMICCLGFMGIMVFASIIFSDLTLSDFEAPFSMFLILFFFFLPIHIFYCFRIIWFNDTEIITKRFLKKDKVYYYEDIIKVTDIVKDKIIVYTTKGKFKADHELLNTKKFLEKMEEKNIPIKKNYFFGKNDN